MDPGTLGRGLSATLGGTDLKAAGHIVRCYCQVYGRICREEEFGYTG